MISVVIPTYNRGLIVAETVSRLFALTPPPDAIIVVDQSREPNEALSQWHREGCIKLIRLDAPSIPHAMNEGLLVATTPVVLFLDDDIEPSTGLIAAHAGAHTSIATQAQDFRSLLCNGTGGTLSRPGKPDCATKI